MDRKLVLLLLLIFPISSAAMNDTSRAYLGAPEGGSRINLEESNALIMPNISLSGAADETYPFDHLPVYSQNQFINGTFSPSQSGNVSDTDTKSKIMLCLSPFNISEYLAGFPENSHFARKDRFDCIETLIGSNNSNASNSNASNGTSFQISKKPAGMYTLYAVDENRSALFSQQPFLITEGVVVLEMNYTVASSEPFIRIKMNTTALENQSKFFAALLIPLKDYKNASLNFSNNKTTGGLDFNLSLGSKSLQMHGTPRISSEFLMNLLPLLPLNSAVGLQESTQPGVDLILMTDRPWETGQYVLTCGIYSPEIGLIGIKQTNVEVI